MGRLEVRPAAGTEESDSSTNNPSTRSHRPKAVHRVQIGPTKQTSLCGLSHRLNHSVPRSMHGCSSAHTSWQVQAKPNLTPTGHAHTHRKHTHREPDDFTGFHPDPRHPKRSTPARKHLGSKRRRTRTDPFSCEDSSAPGHRRLSGEDALLH